MSLVFEKGSGPVNLPTLIYLKASGDQYPKFIGAVLEHESRTIPVLRDRSE